MAVLVIIHSLLWVLLVLIGLAECYLLILTAASLAFRDQRLVPSSPSTRFAVLVPAHDEQSTIGRALHSLAGVKYPASLLEVHVVADNCGDRTAEVVRSFAGLPLRLHERHDPANPGKGQALRWLLSRLEGSYDAFVVLDADCTVSPNLLAAFDARLKRGSRVLQAWYRVAQPEVSWVAGLRYIAFALMNHVRPLGLSALGLSCGLNGTGMCFAAAALRRQGWDSFSLAEDGEHHLKLLMAGLRADFVPEAYVESPMPATLRSAHSQNLRWEGGKLALARAYFLPLATAGLARRDLGLIASAITLAIPPLTIHSVLLAIALVAAVLVRSASAAILALTLILALAVHVAVGLIVARTPYRVLLALLFLPYFVLWKLKLYVMAVRSRGRGSWVRTSRSGEVVR